MMDRRFDRRARALVAGMVITAVLAGCSSSGTPTSMSNSDRLQGIADAMQQARSGRIQGEITAPKSTLRGSISGVWQGTLAGHALVRAQLVSSNGLLLPTEIRVVNSTMYFSRAVGSVPADDPASLFVRASRFKVWRRVNVSSGIATILPSAFSPAALVQLLQRLRAPMRVRSGERLGSVATTRLTTIHPIATGIWIGATVDLWVDARERVVRVQIASASGGARYDVSDFGTAVAVQPPPASEIATSSEQPVIEPAGAFAVMRSGRTAGVTWSLERAPGTQGTVCWRWRAAPPLPQVSLARPDAPRCLVPPGPGADPEDTVQFVVDGNGQGRYDALVLSLPPGAKNLSLGFVGGTSQVLSAAPIVVWIGPPQPVKGYVGVTLADGMKLDCGAGAIATPGDLNDPTVTSRAASAAWACLQHTP